MTELEIQHALMGRMYEAWLERPSEGIWLRKTLKELGAFGLPGEPAGKAWQYLVENRLAKALSSGGGLEGPTINLTEIGIEEAERRGVLPADTVERSHDIRNKILALLLEQDEKDAYDTYDTNATALGLTVHQYLAHYALLLHRGWVEKRVMNYPRLTANGRREAQGLKQ